MHFYKTKWEASTPTKVQINVPTNTDFMVGTELYVKGAKKEITADNVKLIDGGVEIEADTTVNGIPAFTMKSLDAEADKLYDVEFKGEPVVNTAISADNDDFTFTYSSGLNTWTSKKDIFVKPSFYYGEDGKYHKNSDFTSFSFSLRTGGEYTWDSVFAETILTITLPDSTTVSFWYLPYTDADISPDSKAIAGEPNYFI